MAEPDPNQRWWERLGADQPYAGVRQNGEALCLEASLAGAVNHLVGDEIWLSAQALRDECDRNNAGAPNFHSVPPVALKGHEAQVDQSHHDTGPLKLDFLHRRLRDGWIALVSLQLAESGARTGHFHILTLHSLQGEWCQVWDPNGYTGMLMVGELVAPKGIECPGRPDTDRLVPHTEGDSLFLRRRPASSDSA